MGSVANVDYSLSLQRGTFFVNVIGNKELHSAMWKHYCRGNFDESAKPAGFSGIVGQHNGLGYIAIQVAIPEFVNEAGADIFLTTDDFLQKLSGRLELKIRAENPHIWYAEVLRDERNGSFGF